jgi:tRNA/rRNA methyltransferase
LGIRVILLEPEQSGNVGAVARSMKNFGLNDLWIVNPKATVDGEAQAYAMGGRRILESAKIVRNLHRALRGVSVLVGTSAVVVERSSNISRYSITPSQLAEKIAKTKGTVGIVFGRESSGLSNKEVEECDFMITIPADHDYNILNLAMAASIVFYEIFQRKTSASTELASRVATRRLFHEFDLLVKRCGIQMHRRKLARRAFRNVISRSFISKREASLLLGVFRKSLAKLV